LKTKRFCTKKTIFCIFVFGISFSSCGIKGKPVPPKNSSDVSTQTISADSVSATTTVAPATSAPTQKSKNKKK